MIVYLMIVGWFAAFYQCMVEKTVNDNSRNNWSLISISLLITNYEHLITYC
jgi:hypothetical protein